MSICETIKDWPIASYLNQNCWRECFHFSLRLKPSIKLDMKKSSLNIILVTINWIDDILYALLSFHSQWVPLVDDNVSNISSCPLKLCLCFFCIYLLVKVIHLVSFKLMKWCWIENILLETTVANILSAFWK